MAGEERRSERGPAQAVAYEFASESAARSAATELDRRFDQKELLALRIYRVRWNDNYLVEASFAPDAPDSRLRDARALLGEVGRPVHPDDLEDYKRATREGGGLSGWFRNFFS